MWNYWGLLTCRLVTGVGAAMIPPNSMATIADHFPPARRGTPISILLCASFFGVAVGTPLIAVLAEMGGWRLPFYVVGGALLALWWDARGDWNRANEVAQEVEGADGAWVHAYLHRKQGDVGNAGYWYRQAGRSAGKADPDSEWEGIVEELLRRR